MSARSSESGTIGSEYMYVPQGNHIHDFDLPSSSLSSAKVESATPLPCDEGGVPGVVSPLKHKVFKSMKSPNISAEHFSQRIPNGKLIQNGYSRVRL